MNFAKDYMNRDFKILNYDLSRQEAISLIASSSFGVIKNTDQQPIGIVTRVEIEAASQQQIDVNHHLPNTSLLQVGQDVEMQLIVNSPLLETLVQTNALVVGDADEIVGILTKVEIRQFIQSGQSYQKGLTLGTETISNLGGERLGGTFLPLTTYYICRECRYLNTLDAAQAQLAINDPTYLIPCNNPNPHVPSHPLKLNRAGG